MKFALTLPQAQIKVAFEAALVKAAQSTTIKGFRQGKAPLNLVSPTLDQNHLYEQVLNVLFPPAYSIYIKKNQLKPIIQPKLNLKTLDPQQDWVIEVEIAEKPPVELKQYQLAVKQALAKLKPKPEPKDQESAVINLILDTLLKTCAVTIPPLLIDESVDYSLSKLVEQVNHLGLSLDKYLLSTNKTAASLRQEYATNATRDLQIEFILEAVADDLKLHPRQADIDQVVNKIKDPKTQQFVRADASSLTSIRTSLMRRQVLDHLKVL